MEKSLFHNFWLSLFCLPDHTKVQNGLTLVKNHLPNARIVFTNGGFYFPNQSLKSAMRSPLTKTSSFDLGARSSFNLPLKWVCTV